jgi:hypothetical protein
VYLAIFCAVAAAFLVSRFAIPRRLYVPLLLCLSVFIVLPLRSIPEVILDTSRYFVQAKYLAINGIPYFLKEWGKDIHVWTDLPLIPFIYGAVFKVFGEYRLGIQAVNSAFFALTVLTTYLLGKELWGDDTGFYSGLFLVGIPYLLIQVPLMMVDISAMFFFTLSVFMFVRAIRYGGYGNILFSVITILLALLTKYSVWLMLGILPITSIVLAKDSARDVVSRTFTVAGIACTLLLCLILIKYEAFIEQLTILRTYQWPALENWSEGFISTFFFQSHPFIVVLAVYGLYRGIKKKDRMILVPAWFAFFVIVLHVERIRYIIPLFPLFTLMASYGLMHFRLEDIRRFIAYCTVGLSLVIVYSGYAPFLKTTSMANLQNAGRYINSLGSSAVEVYTLPQKMSSGNTAIVVPILDLYTSREIAYRPGNEMPAILHDYEDSSLRFTWEFGLPDFYSDTKISKHDPVVIISGDKNDLFIPEKNPLILSTDSMSMKSFTISSGVFRFKSFVNVYKTSNLSISGQ